MTYCIQYCCSTHMGRNNEFLIQNSGDGAPVPGIERSFRHGRAFNTGAGAGVLMLASLCAIHIQSIHNFK
jgi:hypothetical protein